MFGSLRYRRTLKDVKVVAIVVAMLTAFAAFYLWRSLSSGAVVEGVVVSAGTVETGKACGATRRLASVQLSDGRVVYAFVESGRPLQPGTRVSLQKPWSSCEIGAYEVVALQ